MHSFYQISWVAIIRGGNWLDENFSSWESPVRELSGWDFSGCQFSGWEFSWMGVVLVGVFQVWVFLDGSCPGGDFPGGSFPGLKSSRWDLSWMAIFFGGNFPGGNCPVGIIRVVIFWMGVFMLPYKSQMNGLMFPVIIRPIIIICLISGYL